MRMYSRLTPIADESGTNMLEAVTFFPNSWIAQAVRPNRPILLG